MLLGALSRRGPSASAAEKSLPWSVGHLRWEWVSSLGRLRRQRLKRGGFLGSKEQVVEEQEAQQ
jgi:hypothetical protein